MASVSWLGYLPGLLPLSLLPAFAQQRSGPLPGPLTPCSPSTRPSAAEVCSPKFVWHLECGLLKE